MSWLFLLLNGAKLGKVLLSAGTMLLSLAAYAWLFGWPFAAGFIVLLLIHEMGHFIAARLRGLDVGLPTFIPFVGAWIELKDQPLNVDTEAHIALMGPVAGTLAAYAFFFVAKQQHSSLLMALAHAGFFLNLFNLIPLSPFDGGRITAALSPKIWFAGVPILIAMFLWHPSPMYVLLALLAFPQLVKAWHFDPAAPENQRYYDISAGKRFEYAILYLGLAAYLALMTYESQLLLQQWRPLH